MNSTSNLARAIGTNSIPNQINANCSSSGNGNGGGENENEVELGVEIFQCLQTRTRRVSFQLDQNGEVLVQVLGEKYDREERMIVQNQKNTKTTTRLKLTMDHHNNNNSNSTSHNNPNKPMAIEEQGIGMSTSTSTSMGMTMTTTTTTTTTGTCCQKKMGKTQVLHFDEYEYAHAYERKTNNYSGNNPNPSPSPTHDNNSTNNSNNKSDLNKGASATVAGIVVVEDDFAFAARFAQIKDQFEKLTKKTKEEMKKEWLSPLKYNYNYECDFNLAAGSCPGIDNNTGKASAGPGNGAGLIGIGTGNEQQSQSYHNHHASLFQSQFQWAGGVMTHDGNFQPWFFGKMTRRESENILNNTKPGTFLLRVSEKTGACCYTVSVSVPFPDNNSVNVTTVVGPRKLNCNLNPFPGSGSCPTLPLAPTTPPTTTTIETSTSCRHFLILPIADSPPPFISYKLVGSSQSFNSLATLIHHHGHAPITKSGGEILLHPCPKSSSFTMIF